MPMKMRMWLRSTPQVCKISADLHEDLYGSSYRVTICDRYYEVQTYTPPPFSVILVCDSLFERTKYNFEHIFKTANQRLMLTMTPLENDLHEPWSLLEYMSLKYDVIQQLVPKIQRISLNFKFKEGISHIARKLHTLSAFGFECSLERFIEEVKSYNDLCIHWANNFFAKNNSNSINRYAIRF
ncbi:hypothetical protein HID58_076536 [Brassica napus]|uniref:Uncharacterized protein n=1 Tax=Brassica napus TaxID=3708 RepID=A0ABQ7YMS2_BRANA|nr:hypothetical protein HID58_076536 [Brassica napus]